VTASQLISRWPPIAQCAFWVIISGIFMTLQLAAVRVIANDVSVFEIIFFRGLFGAVMMAPMLIRNGSVLLRPNRKGLIWLCGTLAFIANVFFYLSAKHLPIADITAIHFSRPIFAAVVAAVVLGEALTGNRILAIGLGIVGAAIIIRPGIIDINIGVLYVLGLVAVQSFNPINRKLLSRSEHPDTVAVWNILTILPYGLLFTLFFWTMPTLEQLGWMALIGVMELLNQRVIARAYVQGDAMIVVGFHYTRLPIAVIAGFMFFGETPDIWIWIGALVIALAAIILARGETQSEKGVKQAENTK
jgi:drug/metabolite transporter (DMT)-like permease